LQHVVAKSTLSKLEPIYKYNPTNNTDMVNHSTTCPYKAATTVKFNAYVVEADFEYAPDSGAPNVQHLMQFRYENPNPFFARAKAIRKIRKIKLAFDQPDEKYEYEGISVWLEYSVSTNFRNSKPEIKKLHLLDGENCSREVLFQRFSAEEFLLDVMDYSFVCVDPESSEEFEYAELVDSMFDGLADLKKCSFDFPISVYKHQYSRTL